MSSNSNFLPQLGITQQILEGIQLSNEQKARRDQLQIEQRNSDIAKQSADTASSRLAIETPHIQAATNALTSEAARNAYALASQKRIDDLISGIGPHSETHLASIIGDNGHYGVPLEAPQPGVQAQPVTVSDPTGQILSTPVAPISTAGSAPDQTTPIAQPASGEQGPTLSTQPSTPAQPAASQTTGGIPGMLGEFSRRLGGLTETESDAVNFALEQLKFNRSPEGLSKFMGDLQKIAAQRSQPEYAMTISFMRKGYSEPSAIQEAKRNTAISTELTKIESQPDALTGDKASVAKDQLKALAASPGVTLENREKALRLASVASVAEKNQLAADLAKKKFEQAAKDGDPNAAARLLVSGLVAPSQLISVRNPDFATKAFSAAVKLDPTWNAQKSQADFKAAESPANLNFFGPAKSLVEKGGTLDQLEAAARDIPNGKIPFFNSIDDARKAALGDGPIAKYAAIALGVADDGSKVMSGGVGTDSARESFLHLLPTSASPEARKGSLQGIRGSVNSQIHSRIGNNKVLASMYGDGLTQSAPEAATPSIPAGATHTGVSSVDGKTYYLGPNNEKLGEVR